MPLEPDLQIPEFEEAETEPSKTYYFDFETGRIGRRLIDGIEAIEQFIKKTIKTARFKYPIYSDEYGCEMEDNIGANVSRGFLESETIRTITEALVYDDRIEDVGEFEITFDGDEMNVYFKVTSIEGTIEIREVFNNV